MLETHLVSTIIHVAVFLLCSVCWSNCTFLLPQTHEHMQSPKWSFPPVLNPGLDEMVTAPSKLSEFLLRMSRRQLSPGSCSPSQPSLFLSLTFSALSFLSLCICLLLTVLFHIFFFLMTGLNNRREASQRESSSHLQQRMTAL